MGTGNWQRGNLFFSFFANLEFGKNICNTRLSKKKSVRGGIISLP